MFRNYHRGDTKARRRATASITRAWDTRSFDAAVVPTHESAKRHAERCRKRRQDPLVGGLAGFKALDRAREDAGCRRQLVDAVAACDAKARDAR